jgi:hypothetical protein
MYKANKRHLQPMLISNINDLPEKKRKRLANSWADDFFHYFYSRINEEAFAVLYVDYPSRPNVPINWLVSLETLKAGFGWSDEELYDHFCFDLQVRYALGIHDLNESDFDLRTLYYFRERLSRYNLEHSTNLLTQAFEAITDQQLTTLQVKTGKQRMDSTQIASNILEMSRLQLLVEAVQRMHRSLSETDQQRYAESFAPYLQGHSGQYVYRIKGKEAKQAHLQQIGEMIYHLLQALRQGYAQDLAYQVLERFFTEHFCLDERRVHPKSNQELHADSLQSVDDLEATYRRKGSKDYKGYVANLSETCDPDNALQLITKVQVAPNNTNDRDLLLEALPDLKERTALETLYTDGAYTGPEIDPILAQQQVEQIQSGIVGKILDPGKLSLSDFEIEQNERGVPTCITCPQGQSVPVKLSTRKQSYQADFDPLLCQTCAEHLGGRCPARPGKKRPAFRLTFLASQIAVAKRRRKMRQSKQEGKNHRAAIEGTVREVKHPYPSAKLPVRGLFRMTCIMVSSAAMTNVRRIHHYWEEKKKEKRRKMATEMGLKAASDQQGVSFSSFLEALFHGRRSFFVLPKDSFGC